MFLSVGKWVPRESIYGTHWLNSLDRGERKCFGQDSQILRSVLGYSEIEPVGGSEVTS